jgi:hypothetical protein
MAKRSRISASFGKIGETKICHLRENLRRPARSESPSLAMERHVKTNSRGLGLLAHGCGDAMLVRIVFPKRKFTLTHLFN